LDAAEKSGGEAEKEARMSGPQGKLPRFPPRRPIFRGPEGQLVGVGISLISFFG
jgi:hypothetical protein